MMSFVLTKHLIGSYMCARHITLIKRIGINRVIYKLVYVAYRWHFTTLHENRRKIKRYIYLHSTECIHYTTVVILHICQCFQHSIFLLIIEGLKKKTGNNLTQQCSYHRCGIYLIFVHFNILNYTVWKYDKLQNTLERGCSWLSTTSMIF